MAYFQVPWATKNGALQTFGVESAIVVGLFLMVVPLMQIKGPYLRVSIYLWMVLNKTIDIGIGRSTSPYDIMAMSQCISIQSTNLLRSSFVHDK